MSVVVVLAGPITQSTKVWKGDRLLPKVKALEVRRSRRLYRMRAEGAINDPLGRHASLPIMQFVFLLARYTVSLTLEG